MIESRGWGDHICGAQNAWQREHLLAAYIPADATPEALLAELNVLGAEVRIDFDQWWRVHCTGRFYKPKDGDQPRMFEQYVVSIQADTLMLGLVEALDRLADISYEVTGEKWERQIMWEVFLR